MSETFFVSIEPAFHRENDPSLEEFDAIEFVPLEQYEQRNVTKMKRRGTKSDGAIMYAAEKNPEKFPDGGLEAYLVLFGSFFGLIADFGIANSLGAIEAYVSTHQLKDTKRSNVSWVFSLHLGVMYFGGVIFGEVFDRYGARKSLIAGMLTMCLGLMATANLTTMYQFILSFSIVTALGTSLAMSPLIGVLSHWFLVKRGFACSVATVGGLIGSSIFPVMLQKVYTELGFPWAIRIMSFICFACMMVAVFFVKERRDELQAEQTAFKMKDVGPLLREIFDISVLKDIRFTSLILAIFLVELLSMTILTYLSSFALANGVGELQSYLLITVVNVSGIPSRLISGLLADKYGRFNVMLVTSAVSTVLVFAIFLQAQGNTGLLYAFSVLYGITSSAVLSLIAPCCGQICPASRFGKYYGILYFCLAFLIVAGIYGASLVIGEGSPQDYQNWVIFDGCVGVALIFLWIWARYTNVGFRLCKF